VDDRNIERDKTNLETQMEVVEENATEERQSALSACTVADVESSKHREIEYPTEMMLQKKGNCAAEKIPEAPDKQTLWPAISESDCQECGKGWTDVESDVVDTQYVNEPSMEDFFDDQMLGGLPLDEAQLQMTITDTLKEEISNETSMVKEPRSNSIKDLGLLSLLPQKAKAATTRRRPKIRPSRRKNAANK
jgi:hypothetical protein